MACDCHSRDVVSIPTTAFAALLDANVRLTQALAGLVPSQPRFADTENTPVEVTAPPTFEQLGGDDWEDIPAEPYGSPQPEARAPHLTLHVTEEEEDARYAASQGTILPSALQAELERIGALNTELQIES